jgi:NADH:ubiquinone oxidoreductase subunit 5 (subunit L)/multisubunit Na+/H+ antiporter MnhA subunit
MGSTIAGMIVNAAGITDPGGVQGAQSAAYALLFAFALAPGAAFFIIGRVIQAKADTDAKAAAARAMAQEITP